MSQNMERDKFLTEAMGECFWLGHSCDKCCNADGSIKPAISRKLQANDFSTWPGFGKLFTWATQQLWWDDFFCTAYTGVYCPCGDCDSTYINVDLVDPDRFANSIYEYLVEAIDE